MTPDSAGPARSPREGQAQRDPSSLLLDAREPAGYWEGHLSSSALSTATAVTALSLYQHENPGTPEIAERISDGLQWLADHVNEDGGWGDTDRSLSNLSTTTLVWSAFGAAQDTKRRDAWQGAVAGAETWLAANAGSLDPDRLADSVIRRYGKDRTFSVPILTMAALSGRLGRGKTAWDRVIALPFELAALPRSFFAAVRLPVVSYALPALIAIGLVHHRKAPSTNRAIRWIRSRAEPRTLKVLAAVQPTNGGFLEATPLTSFVTMSLIGAGHATHPVTIRGVEFLMNSVRPDGSWPIDTHLATWLTTLSVNALAPGPGPKLDATASRLIAEWLIRQQYTQVHPYTGARPGGWSWTPLPGGVPDADDTAGAVLALHHLAADSTRARKAACLGIRWLGSLQNRDGGIPTFCRGWGHLPFDRSSPDLTAHALRAWKAWLDVLDHGLQGRTRAAIRSALQYLSRSQGTDGSWRPLWFGNQHAPDDVNLTYGTSRVLTALADFVDHDGSLPVRSMIESGGAWLLKAQNSDGSWGGSPGIHGSIEETALAVDALAHIAPIATVASDNSWGNRAGPALDRGVRWLETAIDLGAHGRATPIGFYFARLWYYERLYPLIFTVGALNAAGRVRKRAIAEDHPIQKPRREK